MSRLSPQERIETPPCDKVARRANHKKSVQPLAQKYFRCSVGQIRSLTPAILSHQRGVGHRRRRWGRERWTRRLRLTSVAISVRRNRLGPTPRCWRQVGGGESFQ